MKYILEEEEYNEIISRAAQPPKGWIKAIESWFAELTERTMVALNDYTENAWAHKPTEPPLAVVRRVREEYTKKNPMPEVKDYL